MTNYKRVRLQGATYFLTLVLENRINTNLLIDNFAHLKSAINKVKHSHPFALEAMVVLPDHLHMIIQLPKGDDDYSTRIRLIKTYFSRYISSTFLPRISMQTKKERGIWQRRFWEHVIRDDADYKKHLDYIHFNPVKHGFSEQVCDWPYSTFHNYVKRGYYPITWGAEVDVVVPMGE